MIGFTRARQPTPCHARRRTRGRALVHARRHRGGFPGLPPPLSVSYRLIEQWYDSGSPAAGADARRDALGHATRLTRRPPATQLRHRTVSLEIVLVLVAAFGAGFIDALAGGGGLIQLPALFATFPHAPHTTLLGTGKLAGFAGTCSAIARFIRHVSSTGVCCCRPQGARLRRRWSAHGSQPAYRQSGFARWCRCC